MNKRTLHYYDDIGLFSPRYKGKNQYRYYDYAQSVDLEYILMLKELNMSLDEIKTYLNHPDVLAFQEIAKQKIGEIDTEIQRLKRAKQILQKKQQQLLLCKKIHNHQIEIIDCEEQYILISPYSFVDDDIETAYAHIKQAWEPELYRIDVYKRQQYPVLSAVPVLEVRVFPAFPLVSGLWVSISKHTHILCFQMRPHIYISIFRLFVGSLQYAGYVLCYPVFFLSWCLLLSLLERALI